MDILLFENSDGILVCHRMAGKNAVKNTLLTRGDALMKYETLDSKQIDDLMNRTDVRKPDGWDEDSNDSKPTGTTGSKEASSDSKDSSNNSEIGGPAQET